MLNAADDRRSISKEYRSAAAAPITASEKPLAMRVGISLMGTTQMDLEV